MDKSADANNIENNNNNCPDDYNKNNNNDVDCFPRQDKQPVLPQQDTTNSPYGTNPGDDDDDKDNTTIV